MTRGAVGALLPLLLAVTVSWSSTAAAAYKIFCDAHGTITTDAQRTARGKVTGDLISGTFTQPDSTYCTWSTVAGQTMYGFASCPDQMPCGGGGGVCPTTAAECAKCLANARDNLAVCYDAAGAHMDAYTDSGYICYMQYDVNKFC